MSKIMLNFWRWSRKFSSNNSASTERLRFFKSRFPSEICFDVIFVWSVLVDSSALKCVMFEEEKRHLCGSFEQWCLALIKSEFGIQYQSDWFLPTSIFDCEIGSSGNYASKKAIPTATWKTWRKSGSSSRLKYANDSSNIANISSVGILIGCRD